MVRLFILKRQVRINRKGDLPDPHRDGRIGADDPNPSGRKLAFSNRIAPPYPVAPITCSARSGVVSASDCENCLT
jgi:hypothetical protein